MKKGLKLVIFTLTVCLYLLTVGCTAVNTDTEEQGQYIIEGNQAAELMGKEGIVFVDMQKTEDFSKEHVKGAVNIPLGDIVMNIPVPNMLAPKGKIEAILGKNGISNETTIVIYDNNKNMDAARLWWTLMVYGHEDMKVVSGGLTTLKTAGIDITSESTVVSAEKYTAKDKNKDMIATLEEMKAQMDDPKKDVISLDTRSRQEYDEGTIPGSMLLDFSENNYKDGTYKAPSHIKIQYIEAGITPDKTVMMFCKTSIRGAQTYLAMYNAGFRNLKLYDGAWVEWSANPSLPVQTPTGNKVEPSQSDNS